MFRICNSNSHHSTTSSTHSSAMSKSMFGSIKNKFTRKNSSSSKEEKRISRRDVRGINEAGTTWNTNNPFLDPSSAIQPGIETPSDAPPAYTASVGPSASSSHLSAGRRGVSPTPSMASITSAEDKYAFLSTFDTVFVIDDSGSMAGRSWREVRDALLAIAPICTSHDPDGIDVYFLNHKSGARGSATQAPNGYNNIRSAAEVQRLFESVRPSGPTPTGNRLQSILNPYITNMTRHPDSMDSIKPVNIIVITDGVPTDDPESIIVHHARRLDVLNAPPHQVGIQFFQVGTEQGASAALKELDDDLADLGIRDMVDTVTWSTSTSNRSKSLSADGILKVVLGAVVRRIDRKSVSRSPSRNRN
ncbi:hypothetical protein B0J13DRAFT_544573 [Dactylonectria estremocensis]|uniref:VWFA domain-containing protein n=1 Tax=Dactylonectria estremocensis TaxID=1079267 RepID=A0A9P9F3T5_9HYPO|nr:hypothetical protein B0J13DRAFT_544573 [Dactylonectria estremocensis]